MQDISTMQMACEERKDFADFLDGLSPEQWEQPSLCELWRVRDVVAHVVSYEELSRWQLVRRFAKGGLVPPRVNALSIGRAIPPQRLQRVLDLALRSPATRGARKARGVRLIATDLNWAYGDGLEVTGPGEAILMAIAGRPDALNQLSGPGKAILAQRI